MTTESIKLVNPLSIVAGSLAFVGGLAWNDAIQAWIGEYYPVNEKKNAQAKLLYALIVTMIIVIVVLFLRYVNETAVSIGSIAIKYEKNRALSQQYSK
jgi:hypothetical protein